jgi:GT2 family glycosyltransferase
MAGTPELSVIIVSYNTREMTLDCLRALHDELGDRSAEVWLVDNASSDGSAAAIRAAFPQVLLIENERNAGFGAANNQAMRQARGKFFLLLNSDAFPKPGAVAALIDYLREHPRTAVVGPRLLNADGSLQRSCYRFPTPLHVWSHNLWVAAVLPQHPVLGDYRRWAHDTERSVDWVIGACLLVRREAYEQVGGFDEAFFMYAEETDWQRRLRASGWEIAFTPEAEVTHLGGASGASEKERVREYFFGSLDHYTRKHHGLPGLVSLRLAMTIGCSMRALLWGLVLAGAPGRRAAAQKRVRTNSWLVLRQMSRPYRRPEAS